MKRVRRSVQELITERETQLESLKVKQLLSEAEASPVLAPIVEAINDVRTQRTNTKKGFSSGPQSFSSRVESHQLWIDEIEAERAYASAALATLEDHEQTLKSGLSEMALKVANGEDVTKLVSAIVDSGIMASPEVDGLLQEYGEAKMVRKNFLAYKRMSKKDRAQEAD